MKIKYKRLTQQDIIQAGDEYKTTWGTWTKIEPTDVGVRKGSIMGYYVKMRRQLPDKNGGEIHNG